MNGIMTSKEVGHALMQAGLSPFSLDADVFQIVHGGENYIVHTDRLPEIYIEKKVPLYYFEFKGENWIVCYAMDRINARRTPVVVFRAEATDTITFRICICPESVDAFAVILEGCFLRIEQAMDAFGQACEAAVREDEEEAMSDLMKDLADPAPDSPWLRRKTRS